MIKLSINLWNPPLKGSTLWGLVVLIAKLIKEALGCSEHLNYSIQEQDVGFRIQLQILAVVHHWNHGGEGDSQVVADLLHLQQHNVSPCSTCTCVRTRTGSSSISPFCECNDFDRRSSGSPPHKHKLHPPWLAGPAVGPLEHRTEHYSIT